MGLGLAKCVLVTKAAIQTR